MTRILVVDDEVPIRRALCINLRARGYEVIEATSGSEALQRVASERPDAMLVDLGLPGMSGLEVIEAVRGWSELPIVVLTVRDDERAKVQALDAGADDYVTKPFGMDELLARLRAALRRAPTAPGPVPVVSTADWTLDLAARTVVSTVGEDIKLTATEWGVVEFLVRHAGRLVTHRQLLDAVWGPTYEPDHNLLRVHLGHIRRKLEPDPARPRYFCTEPGMGYRFRP